MQPQNILVVDDDPDVRTVLHRTLDRLGHAVTTAGDGDRALGLIHDDRFSLVITDVRLPGMSGLELLNRIKRSSPRLPVIVITGYGSVQNAVDAMQEGASDYLLKPFANEALEAAINRAAQTLREQPEATLNSAPAATSSQGRILTQDPQLLNVLEMADNVACSNATVLIQGESGTGKELLARYLHEVGNRSEHPYLAVNCAALPDTLAESELFGHEKGAFTGAISRKIGKFEAVAGGTIVLDEISEMSLNLQAKLLRVLQERQVDRIGSNRPVPVAARVIAISNVDLKQAADEGKFRKDLFYRVNVVPLRVPALRERRADIPLLVRHFCERFSAMNGKAGMQIEDDAIERLMGHSWPGNVRELENTIERGVLIAPGSTIRAQDLILEPEGGERAGSGSPVVRAGHTVRDLEKQLILTTLEAVNENRTQAAEMLGISIRTLRNKLKEYREHA